MEKRVQGSDYESVTELAIHCKKEGVSLEDLVSVLRIKNYIQQLGSIDEE
jgi:chromosome segregation and condensation protein ScpB